MTRHSSARPLVARLGVAAFAAVAVATLVADVVLQPGYITGTLQLQGVTVTQANVYAYAGNASSQTTTTTGSYQLTVNVPQAGSQQYTLQTYLYSDQNRDYLQVPDRLVTVTAGSTTVENYNVTSGFIQGTVTVTGGTIQNGYVYASRQTQPYGYAQTQLVGTSGAFLFPANAGASTLSGSVTVNGVSITLPAQQVTVTAGQTITVNFAVAPAQNSGAITGLLQFSGAATPFRVDVTASGPVSRTAQLTQAGAFSLNALADGNYSMYAYAYFGNTQKYLYLPNTAFAPMRSLTISAGNTLQRDVTVAANSVAGSVVVTGPRTLSATNSAWMYADGLSPSPAASGFAQAPISIPSGAFDLALTNGIWRPRSYLQFFDSNPQTYLNSSMEVYDLQQTAQFTVNGPTTLASVVYDVGTVSVVMAVPAPLTFSNPNIFGWCYERAANNVVLRQYYVNASRNVSNVSSATVTFVGLKGSCDLQARVTISGGSVGIGQVLTAVVPGVEQNVDIGGPTLTMTAPTPNEVTTGTSIVASGRATDDAQVQSVTVNNTALALTSTNNPNDPREVSFSTTVSLPALGAHTITTRATDIAGKVTTDTRTVYRKAQPVISWAAPAAIPSGTALSGTQLNATASVGGQPVAGVITYNPAAGTMLPVGQGHALSATFTPTDQTRYLTAEASVAIDVLSSQPTIVWPTPAAIVYGAALGATQLNATAESDGSAISGTFAYSPEAGTVLPAGTHQLSVTFTPTNASSYQGATSSVTIAVTPAVMTVTANNASRGYGADNPGFSASIAGFVAGDDASDLGGALTFTTAADAASNAGSYAITPSGLTSANYAIEMVAGTLTVSPAPLTVTADNASRPYGAANPSFTASYAGFVLGQGSGVLGGTLAFSTPAGATAAVGDYSITPSGLMSANYAIAFVAGTLHVTPTTLTVSVLAANRTYGAANPAFVVQYSGFQGADTASLVTGTPTFTTTATAGSPVGEYPVTPGGVSAQNYTLAFVNGTLTITPATLTVTANTVSRAYGTALAGFTASYQGFENGDDPADLAGTLTFGGTAPGAVNVGTYTIVPSGVSSSNYALRFVTGTLTVTPASLTIRADDKSMVINGSVPSFTATYTGLMNGDTPASLDQPATLASAANGQLAGSFAITAGGASDQNYTITSLPGTLAVSFSTAACLGEIGKVVLQPVNADGTSVFKQKSTVPIKFRVCDANGVSVSSGVVSSFLLVQRITGTVTVEANEAPLSTTPDSTFRWDPSAQQWIFNLNTKGLQTGVTYRYQVGLTDGTSIPFQFGLR